MKTFDFSKVNLILTESTSGAQHIVTGFANNSTIDAAYAGDAFTKHIGAKGGDDAAFAVNNDHSGTIKFKLMSTSESNKTLVALYNNRTEFSAYIVDGNDISKSECGGDSCILQKPADYSRGEEIQSPEYTIGVLNLKINYD